MTSRLAYDEPLAHPKSTIRTDLTGQVSPAPDGAERIRKLDELTTDLKGVQLVTDDALFSAEEAS